jgi:catechol 2,3-dioxygenase-like lactoylglutathione lyase family enzyme
MKLHEIELFSKDPGVTASFYSGILGLKLGGSCATKGILPRCNRRRSQYTHQPSAKVSLSFLVKEVNALVKAMKEKKIEWGEVYESHLGLKAVTLTPREHPKLINRKTR